MTSSLSMVLFWQSAASCSQKIHFFFDFLDIEKACESDQKFAGRITPEKANVMPKGKDVAHKLVCPM